MDGSDYITFLANAVGNKQQVVDRLCIDESFQMVLKGINTRESHVISRVFDSFQSEVKNYLLSIY